MIWESIMDRLYNKVAIITGGVGGIGKSTIKSFVNEGAKVFVTDIRDDIGHDIEKNYKNTKYFHLDVRDKQNWKDAFESCIKTFGKVDILFNNAGVIGTFNEFGYQDPENATFESWKIIHDINLNSVFLGCKYAIKHMKENGGTIINMSSRSGIVGVPNSAAYSSSKAAIRNFSKSVALYCAQMGYKIRCNSIHPAAILTDMWSHMLGNSKEEQDIAITKISSTIPLKKMGEPLDVANLVVYLASDESKYMTGSEIILDGGILAGSVSSPSDK